MTSLPQTYEHPTETRTPNEIHLTNKLARIVSQRNLHRIHTSNPTTTFTTSSFFYFICLSGIPPFQNEYQNLDLPGEKTVISLQGLKGIRSQQEYRKIFQIGGFEYEAKKMRKVVEEKSGKFKIVVLFHSFGSFTFMNYLRMFPQHKLSGIIDIGGAPLRYYPLLSNLISNFHMITHQFLLQNHVQIHQAYLSDPQLRKAGFIPFQNSYQTIIFLKLATCPSFKTMFTYMRNLPQILKLFVYGCQDRIFPQPLINEKVVYYSYVKVLQKQYEEKMSKAYEEYYGVKGGSCKNVQDRFVFGIQNGQHSLHMQNRYNTDIKKAVKHYLGVLSIGLQN